MAYIFLPTDAFLELNLLCTVTLHLSTGTLMESIGSYRQLFIFTQETPRILTF
jgi:hypothetical protein